MEVFSRGVKGSDGTDGIYPESTASTTYCKVSRFQPADGSSHLLLRSGQKENVVLCNADVSPRTTLACFADAPPLDGVSA